MRPLVAIGCVVALALVVVGTRYMIRTEPERAVPPSAEPMEVGDSNFPLVEDPRDNPAFDEAYATVCGQTLIGLDAILAAQGLPDLVATITSEHQALTQRLTSVYSREDLWSATDPLVLEYAEAVADDLASILDGTDVGLAYLEGDVTLFRSLCDDWFTPL
jgi:hypothetical protein